MRHERREVRGRTLRIEEFASKRLFEHEDERRGLLFMYLIAPAIGILTLLLPHSLEFQWMPSLVLMITGFFVALAVAALPRASFVWVTHVALLYAVLAITSVNLVSKSPSAPYVAFYFWPVLFSAWYLGARATVAYTALCASGLAVVLASLPPRADGPVRFVSMIAAFAVSAFAIAWSRARVDEAVRGLELRSSTDALTGLANRGAFDAALDRLIHDASEAKRPLTLVLFDLDDFKRVNDTHGHPGGDRALRRLARALLRRARMDDVVARIGGDEFGVLLPRAGGEDAHAFAREVLANLEEVVDGEPKLGASVGIAEYPLDAVSRGGLLEAADRALYASKRTGRNGAARTTTRA